MSSDYQGHKKHTDPSAATDADRSVSRGTNAIDLLVGANLRSLRLERNMTVEAIADQLGVSEDRLEEYETGAVRISGVHVVALATLFDVKMTKIFGIR